jgi:N-acetylglutamate synthase-like GNAT family acetyltransferase
MNNLTVRRLKPVEYEKLLSVSDGYTPDPNRSVAVVAENGHHIIGRIFLIAPAHAEGIFIEPPWRGGNIFKELMDALEIEAKSEKISKLLAYATSTGMEEYISRKCGYTRMIRDGFPVTVWQKELS